MTNNDLKRLLDKAKILDKRYNSVLNKWGITTKEQRRMYFAQGAAESGLTSKRESLYYSTITNARNTFKSPFRGKTDAFVKQYLKNSVKMANYVYANREGNGNEASGDGYKFRGGGILQNTFKRGYEHLEKRTGIPFSKNPDLILEEPNAIIAACVYWSDNNINKYVALGGDISLDRVSDIINIGRPTQTYGDSNGFKERKLIYDYFVKYF